MSWPKLSVAWTNSRALERSASSRRGSFVHLVSSVHLARLAESGLEAMAAKELPSYVFRRAGTLLPCAHADFGLITGVQPEPGCTEQQAATVTIRMLAHPMDTTSKLGGVSHIYLAPPGLFVGSRVSTETGLTEHLCASKLVLQLSVRSRSYDPRIDRFNPQHGCPNDYFRYTSYTGDVRILLLPHHGVCSGKTPVIDGNSDMLTIHGLDLVGLLVRLDLKLGRLCE